MKKLMFAAVAAAGITGFAVESQVVGYTTTEAVQGDALFGASFTTVGGGTYDLVDVTVNGAVGYGDVDIQFVGSDGGWGEHFWYYDADNGAEGAGWYVDVFGSEKASTFPLDTARAFYMTSSEVEVTLGTAGQVPTTDEEVTAAVAMGDAMVANPTPTPVNFAYVEVVGAAGYGDVDCQRVGTDGAWGEHYWYYDDSNGAEGAGWYVDVFGSEKLPEEGDDAWIMGIGEGIYFTSSEADINVVFPKPL